jgi:DNA-binding cell septation regulator SpoVG
MTRTALTHMRPQHVHPLKILKRQCTNCMIVWRSVPGDWFQLPPPPRENTAAATRDTSTSCTVSFWQILPIREARSQLSTFQPYAVEALYQIGSVEKKILTKIWFQDLLYCIQNKIPAVSWTWLDDDLKISRAQVVQQERHFMCNMTSLRDEAPNYRSRMHPTISKHDENQIAPVLV